MALRLDHQNFDTAPAVELLQSGRVAHRAETKIVQESFRVVTGDAGLLEVSGSDYAGFATFPIVFAIGLLSLLSIPLFKHSADVLDRFSAYIAEFVGTFALVFTVGCCVSCGSGTWNATAIGCVLMIMIYATGPISGGNLNPAVSFSLSLCGKQEWSVTFGYWAAQVAAGVSASCFFTLLFWPKAAVLGPVAPFSWYHAIVVEIIYTFMLCFVVNNCAASKRNNKKDDGNQFFALAIGFVIVAGGYAAGGISGACFNPAVSIGLDIASPSDGMHWCFLWALVELLGGALAALAFRFFRPEDYYIQDEQQLATFDSSLGTKCLSEFLGVFILVLTVGLNVVMASPSTAFSAAAALMCMIYSLGDVSGGHFNPSVTLAVVMSGREKCSAAAGAAYLGAQLVGGVVAGLLYAWFHASGPNSSKTYGLDFTKHGSIAAGVAEMFYTFVLAYVVLTVATVKKPASQLTSQNFYFALCIGSSVTVGGFAIGSVSGGELNPAVSLGISVASSVYSGTGSAPSFVNFVVIALWELVGGVLAALVFFVTHAGEYKDSGFRVDFAKYACEFVGTFALMFTVVCVVIAGDATWGVTAIGCVLMVMIYATGPISGGKLNPSVSLSLALCGKLDFRQMALEWIAQILGGLAAGFSACALLSPKYVAVAPVSPYSWYHAMVVEIIYTCMLCFVVNSCAASKKNNPATDGNQFFALAIGFVIIAGGYAGGKVSGAAFNPAVALGLDISGAGDGIGWGFAWAAFEIVGAALASLLFYILRPEDYSDADPATYTPGLVTRCISEFFGVFILVFTVGMNVVNSSTATAWSAAAALMCMIYSLGDVSGGHFNPAVTLAVVMSGREKCSMYDGGFYFMVQMLAGVCAGCLYAWFHSAGPNSKITFGLAPAPGYTMYAAGFVELFFTMVLAYVVLACATVVPAGSQKTKQNFYFALCIGSAVTVGGNAIGAVSGGELNPAVSLGISTGSAVHTGLTPAPMFENFILFGLWELGGGLLAAAIFHLTNAREYLDSKSKN